jgi:DNA repair protein RadC
MHITPNGFHPSTFTAREASIIKKALNLIEEKRLRDVPLLHYFEDFQWYLMLRFAGLTNEQGHVLYLNINRELLSAETEFFGNQSAVTFDLRKIALRAITLGAEHVVFAHNHPNNNPAPSAADLRHLDWSEKALAPLSINVLDSYVVTAHGITSIKKIRKENQDADMQRRIEVERQRTEERRARREAKKAAAAEGKQA